MAFFKIIVSFTIEAIQIIYFMINLIKVMKFLLAINNLVVELLMFTFLFFLIIRVIKILLNEKLFLCITPSMEMLAIRV